MIPLLLLMLALYGSTTGRVDCQCIGRHVDGVADSGWVAGWMRRWNWWVNESKKKKKISDGKNWHYDQLYRVSWGLCKYAMQVILYSCRCGLSRISHIVEEERKERWEKNRLYNPDRG